MRDRGDAVNNSGSLWIDQLHTSLSREMDAAHKTLVRARKTNLNQ